MRGHDRIGIGLRARGMQLGALLGYAMLTGSCASATAAERWQCHAPNGSYAVHDIRVPENATRIVGEMIFHRNAGPSQWHPYATVGFVDTATMESDCHCNGITATWYESDPTFITVGLATDGEDAGFARVPYDKPVTFRLAYARNGALKLNVGTAAATGVSPNPARNALHLNCSSADVDFRITEILADEPKSPERCPFAAQEQWSAQDVDRYCKVRR